MYAPSLHSYCYSILLAWKFEIVVYKLQSEISTRVGGPQQTTK